MIPVSNRSGRQEPLFFFLLSRRMYSYNVETDNTILNRKCKRERGRTDLFYEFSFRLAPHLTGQCDHILNFNLKRSVQLKEIQLKSVLCTSVLEAQSNNHSLIRTCLPLSAWCWSMIYEAILAATVLFCVHAALSW